MNNTAEIKRRLASVKQTRQITGAMETISVAKMRKAVELCEQNRAYFEHLRSVVKSIAAMNDVEVKEYIAPKRSGAPLVAVIASDKGLCGGFNHDVFKLADTVITPDSSIIPIGQTAAERYAKCGGIIDDFVSVNSSDFSGAKRLSEYILQRYGSEISDVTVVYTEMKSMSVYEPVAVKLLPFERDENVDCTFEFDPSPAVVLERLMPMYTAGMLFGAVINSAACEHCARRAAMSASTKNADEMIEILSVEQNRARQSSVTEQITEIAGATQALDGGSQ